MSAALALLTSVLYGVSNFLGPRISKDLPVFAVLIAGQLVALAVATLLALGLSDGFLSPLGAATALGAGVGNAVGLYAFYRAASEGPLAIVAPIGALGAVVPVLAGVVAGETLGAVRAIGIALAVAGVALASRRPGGAPISPGRHPVAWAAFAALGFGAFLSLVAPAAASDPLWTVSVSRVSLLAVLLAVVVAAGSPVRVPVASLPRVALPGLLLFAGTLAYAAATTLGDLSVVSVLASSNPVVTVALAFALSGERLSPGQGAGVGLALAGVALVSTR